MENPCLTFVISSILECDEFLVIDVIHEVAHSWFGNAVTNATWEEMWLSEGLATYAQRRITTETYGTACGQPRGRGREVRALLWTRTGWHHQGCPRHCRGADSQPSLQGAGPCCGVSREVALGQLHKAQGREGLTPALCSGLPPLLPPPLPL